MWSSRKATGPTSLGRWRGRGAGLRLTRSRLALLLIVLALLLGGGAWGAGLSPAAIFSRNTPSYISPDGAVSQDTKHPTSFGDADDLQQLAPPAPPLAVGSATVSGHITDAATGLPVTNANVGISLGAVGSGATYATTAADGSYSFSALAAGTYNLASSRYTVSGTAPLYQYATRMGVAVNTNVIVDFALNPIAVPGSRGAVCNRAQNLILIDYDETYYESWFTDPNSMVNRSPAIHSVAARGVNAAENWTSYGWSPIDHFQIAVGGYPAWRSPDAPAAVWGQPDGLDTNIWYNGSEHFLMSSVFDVAKSHGMATGVIGGSDYPTGHITDANVDLIQLAANPSGVPTIWATETENFITAHASNPNGFFIYLPATMAEGRTVESTSPDAAGGAYQTASSQDDQAMQTLLNWLQTNGYMGNTVIAFTADEAENDHTSFDNFYGNGTTGGGTTRHVPFTIAGPGIVSGPVTYPSVMNMDDESTNLLAALNLPPNVDSRGHLINAFFQPLNCGGGTPTAVPPTNTPVPGATATSTRIPAPTATNTPLPPPTNTPVAGGNLVVNGGFETGNISPWTTLLGGGSAAIATSPVHSGSDSGKVTTGASGS
ncbi:MAG: carboxypeptidase regulatory-like domain-containing protein, partial [Chloroflexia bacterium]